MSQQQRSDALTAAIVQASRLMAGRPEVAAKQAIGILRAIPDQPEALLILGGAKRQLGDFKGSRAVLDRLVKLRPEWADAFYAQGLTLAALGLPAAAAAAIRRTTELNPLFSDAWRALAEQFNLVGDRQSAISAHTEHIIASTRNPALVAAATSLDANRLDAAEQQLKDYLSRFQNDVVAIRMLAELASRLEMFETAEALLVRCLDLAPGYAEARQNYAYVLHRRFKQAESIVEIDRLMAIMPNDPTTILLKAAGCVHVGKFDEAADLYLKALKIQPDQPKVWLSYGHTQKTLGRRDQGVEAYRRSIAYDPGMGEAYWSLVNLKTYRLGEADIAAIHAQLARPDLDPEERLHFHFALGKAKEDAGDYADAFAQYNEGNRLRRAKLRYSSAETTERTVRLKRLFDAAFLEARADWGAPAPDPIFVVGLPRSGSTLIEQILASHSRVEGTMELPDLPVMVKALSARKKPSDVSRYPEVLGEMTREQLAGLGEEYLKRTQIQRKTGRPFFIDKLPNNFMHVGMIMLILPNARIIDARRHPLATCFSGFKQHFARGQPFSYDLTDIGQFYADYVGLMAHFDTVAPGRIHRVQYETMVADTETEIRRLLDYCGLAFEEPCLRFWENDRSVRTPSAEQVRRPIFSESLDHWRHFEPWLDPLKQALGPVLDDYPAPPVPAGDVKAPARRKRAS